MASREARKAKHIRKNNLALCHNVGKMNIPKIFNQILGMSYSTTTAVSLQTQMTKLIIILLLAIGPLGQ